MYSFKIFVYYKLNILITHFEQQVKLTYMAVSYTHLDVYKRQNYMGRYLKVTRECRVHKEICREVDVTCMKALENKALQSMA